MGFKFEKFLFYFSFNQVYYVRQRDRNQASLLQHPQNYYFFFPTTPIKNNLDLVKKKILIPVKNNFFFDRVFQLKKKKTPRKQYSTSPLKKVKNSTLLSLAKCHTAFFFSTPQCPPLQCSGIVTLSRGKFDIGARVSILRGVTTMGIL